MDPPPLSTLYVYIYISLPISISRSILIIGRRSSPMTMGITSLQTKHRWFITERDNSRSFLSKEIFDVPFALDFEITGVKILFTIERSLRYPRKKKKEKKGDDSSDRSNVTPSLIESTPRKGNPLEASRQGIRERGFIEEKRTQRNSNYSFEEYRNIRDGGGRKNLKLSRNNSRSRVYLLGEESA